MRVNKLISNPEIYSCNSYLVRGDWNAIPDMNTIIDAGTDGFIMNDVFNYSTGVGKKRIDQIILTHEHFDHSGGVQTIKSQYNDIVVYAFNKNHYVDEKLNDGMHIRIGDELCEIMHTPVHSQDSICIYCPFSKLLFSGDLILFINSIGGTYTQFYLDFLERLYKMEIDTIYPGHGNIITQNIRKRLDITIQNIKNSDMID